MSTESFEDNFPRSSREKLLLETGTIPWLQLQPWFAQGKVIWVAGELDLVEVGFQFSEDNKGQFERWISEGLVAPVNDEQALTWFEQQAELWALVLKPYVLVQDQKPTAGQ